MKISFLSIFLIPFFAHFCSDNADDNIIVTPATSSLVVKTIDSFGNPKLAKLIYEQVDCEFDFNDPKSINSNQNGIAVLNLDSGYLQIYADGFLHESYVCFNDSKRPDTLVLYADKIPTFIEVKDACGMPVKNAKITYFSNTSGNCDFEGSVVGELIKTNKEGKAMIFLPPSDTYKIQVETRRSKLIECFQPDQTVHTLSFKIRC